MAPGPGLLDDTFCVYAKTYGQIGIKLCTYTSSQNSLSQWGCIIHCILSVRCMRSISRTLTLFDVCKVLYFPLLKAYLQHNKTPWHQTLSWSQKILCIFDQLRLFCVCMQHGSSSKSCFGFQNHITMYVYISLCKRNVWYGKKMSKNLFHTALSFGGQIDHSTLYISFVPLVAIFREYTRFLTRALLLRGL